MTLRPLILQNSSLLLNASYIVNPNELHQTIDGFVAYAGRAHSFFQHAARDKILEKLYADTGLHLSILRGEVFSSYSPSAGVINYDVNDDINIAHNSSFFSTADILEQKRRGQLWIFKKVIERYGDVKLTASTWSPPLYMKTTPVVNTGSAPAPALINSLNPTFRSQYASFLAGFAKTFTNAGMPIYALSPQNEPEFPSTNWEGCVWLPT